jgi:hypothetical protein
MLSHEGSGRQKSSKKDIGREMHVMMAIESLRF